MGTASRVLGVALASLALLPALAAAQTPWRHGIIEAKSDAGFQVMAVRAGFTQKLGLDLKYFYFQNDVIMLRALLAGELDSFEGTPSAAIVIGSRGGGVKIIGCHWQNVVHSVFARAEFKGPQDLKGATMVMPALRPEEADMRLRPWADPENFNAGYVMRSQHILFRQGDREPWTHLLEHEQEREILPAADLDDGTLVYR